MLLLLCGAAVSLIFSFTNGSEWDGPYAINFKIPKAWKYQPMSFFNEVQVLSHEL